MSVTVRRRRGGRAVRLTLAALPAAALTAALTTAVVAAPAGSAGPVTTGRHQLVLPDGPWLRGDWRVVGDAAVWRAPGRVPVTDAGPVLRVGATVVNATYTPDGRGVTVPSAVLAGLDTRALQVWVGLRRLDRRAPTPASVPLQGSGYPDAHVRVVGLDPGLPGVHQPEPAFDYTAAPLASPTFGDLDVHGRAVLPAGVDDAPLVVFLHGQHLPCYGSGPIGGEWPCPDGQEPVPSYRGYEYAQRLLATQGYASVSIDANAINALEFTVDDDDAGARARSALVRHTLNLLAGWTDDPDRGAWFGRIDPDRVVLVGHSRGGEGVARAVIDRRPTDDYRVLGEVLVAPTAFSRVPTAYMPSVTLLPYCDGDVVDLRGQRYTDLARDLAAGDTAFRTSVLLRGANHNFFNTEWTPRISEAPSVDDWARPEHPMCGRDSATRLTPAEQRAVGKVWIASAVRLFVRGDTRQLRLLDAGGAVTTESVAAGAGWSEALGGDRDLVRPGPDAEVTGAAMACRAAGDAEPPDRQARLPRCGRDLPWWRQVHWRYRPPPGLPLQTELELAWTDPGAVGGLELRDPLDLSAPGTSLDLRTVVEPGSPPVTLDLRLGDGDDRWTTSLPGRRGFAGGFVRTYWAQTLRADLSDAPTRLDLTHVTSIELVTRSRQGRVWVLDAAGRRPGLLPVPDVTLPRVSLGSVRVDEGDAPDDGVAQVPYRLSSPAPAGARFVAIWFPPDSGEGPFILHRVVRVPEGATTGTVAVTYDADSTDDPRRTVVGVSALPFAELSIGDWTSQVVVIDDDPRGRQR